MPALRRPAPPAMQRHLRLRRSTPVPVRVPPMSRDRGVRLQNALAAYLRAWWPNCESAGAGRQGRDILGTPGVWWENKAESTAVMCKRKGGPASYVRQADQGSLGDSTSGVIRDVPVTVWWP